MLQADLESHSSRSLEGRNAKSNMECEGPAQEAQRGITAPGLRRQSVIFWQRIWLSSFLSVRTCLRLNLKVMDLFFLVEKV